VTHPVIVRLTRFTATAVALLAIGAVSFGATGCAATVRFDTSVTVWDGLYGVNTRYRAPDTVCVSMYRRTDTTEWADIDEIMGPHCFDAASYLRSFFVRDTTTVRDTIAPEPVTVPSPIG
jgi:hypothetical protein